MKPVSPFFDIAGPRIDLDSGKPPRLPILLSATAILILFAFASVLVFKSVMANYARFTRGHQSVLWISDIHLDSLYRKQSNASTWCHRVDPQLPVNFTFGHYGCDTPPALFGSLVASLPRLIARPTMIVLGGDNIGGVWPRNYSMGQVWETFEMVLEKLRLVFPKTAVLPVIGNNELVPNYGTWENDSMNFAILAKMWGKVLSERELETLRRGGYYYRDFDRLRVVVLNTVMYQVYRSFDDRDDPYGQFAWLDRVCEDAQRSGLQVSTFFHVPPSMSTRDRFKYQGWYQKYADQFAEVFAKYRFSMMCGHLHIAAILPLFNNVDNRDGYILSAPALSMRHDSNPGFRLIKFRNGAPIDYDEYSADVGAQPVDVLPWRLEYSFNALYGTRDLSHGQLADLADRLRKNSSLMWRYRRMMYQRQFFTRQVQGCLLRSVSHDEITECTARAPDARSAIFHNLKYLPPSA
jgi:sphingomyelin phosphodiesterase acid-like 3